MFYWWSIILPFLSALLIYLYLLWKRTYSYWSSLGIPGPTPLPYFGNILTTFIKPYVYESTKWYQNYGSLIGVYRFDKPELLISDPELIKQYMVKDFNSFRNRRPIKRRINSLFEKMLPNLRDDEWRRMRNILNPVFTTRKLKQMVGLLDDCCTRFMTQLDKTVDRLPSGADIDIRLTMKDLSLDMIASAAFGTRIDIYGDQNHQFLQNVHRIIAFPTYQMCLLTLFPTLSGLVFKLVLWFTKAQTPDKYFYEFLLKILRDRQESGVRRNDLMQILVDIKSETTTTTSTTTSATTSATTGAAQVMDDELLDNEDRKQLQLGIYSDESYLKTDTNKSFIAQLTDDEIFSQCFVFFFADFESLAAAVAHTLYELALQPDIQSRLRQECRQAISGTDNTVDYDKLMALPYLDACVSETIRKYPTAGVIPRQAMADVKLGDTGITIPKGMIVDTPVYPLHHDPNYFPDPYGYKPDRFMPENRDQIVPYSYLPFGAGPRHCIGMRFALLEAKIGLARILQRYQFYRVDRTTVPVQFRPHPEVLLTKPVIIGVKKIVD